LETALLRDRGRNYSRRQTINLMVLALQR